MISLQLLWQPVVSFANQLRDFPTHALSYRQLISPRIQFLSPLDTYETAYAGCEQWRRLEGMHQPGDGEISSPKLWLVFFLKILNLTQNPLVPLEAQQTVITTLHVHAVSAWRQFTRLQSLHQNTCLDSFSPDLAFIMCLRTRSLADYCDLANAKDHLATSTRAAYSHGDMPILDTDKEITINALLAALSIDSKE